LKTLKNVLFPQSWDFICGTLHLKESTEDGIGYLVVAVKIMVWNMESEKF
jgi:hypothetical protein